MEGDRDMLKAIHGEFDISTHALTWRATSLLALHAAQLFQFLPTPSHGGRHAPGNRPGENINFYPRPHMEGDPNGPSCDGLRMIFLPTPSHGGRPPHPWFLRTSRYHFYPRPHMEGDVDLTHFPFARVSFLPTPSHGGRQQTC